jgi:hypothetical protein
MRQPINFTQSEVDEIAIKATGLSEWLEEKASSAASRIVIPPSLTTVASSVTVTGLLILLDKAMPTTQCWGGGCVT